MKIDTDRIEDLLKQADRWIRDGAKPSELKLGLRWSGQPDRFEADYDREDAGLLVLALASDPVLAAAAWAALLKVISEYGDPGMKTALDKFVSSCEEIHRSFKEDGLCESECVPMPARSEIGS